MKELNEAIGVLQRRSYTIMDSLEETADSARSLGLDRLADRSEKQIEMLRSAVDDVSKAYGLAIQEYFQRAQEGSANMLRAALAGASLDKSD